MKVCIPVPLALAASGSTADYIRRRVGAFFVEKGIATELAPLNGPMEGDFDVIVVPIDGSDKVLNTADVARVEVIVDTVAAWPYLLFITSRQTMGWKPPKGDEDFPDAFQPMMSEFLEFTITAELGNLTSLRDVWPHTPD